MLSNENPPPDLSSSPCEISQLNNSSRSSSSTDDDQKSTSGVLQSDLLISCPKFSIRDYAFSNRRKDIKTSWPFSEKSLQLCLNRGVKYLLPPSFDVVKKPTARQCTTTTSLDSKDNQYHLVDAQPSLTSLDTNTCIFASMVAEAETSVNYSASKRIKKRSLVANKVENNTTNNFMVSETMASKVCPVCKTFTSSSNTTLNAHIDQCLSGKSSSQWTSDPKPTKSKIKPKRMRSMVDIYATAKHCTIEELERRNGIINLASSGTSLPAQDMEVGSEERKRKSPVDFEEMQTEAAVYVDANGTKLRILSKLNGPSSPVRAGHVDGENSSKLCLAKKKKNKFQEKHHKLQIRLSDSKKLCSPRHHQKSQMNNIQEHSSGSEEHVEVEEAFRKPQRAHGLIKHIEPESEGRRIFSKGSVLTKMNDNGARLHPTWTREKKSVGVNNAESPRYSYVNGGCGSKSNKSSGNPPAFCRSSEPHNDHERVLSLRRSVRDPLGKGKQKEPHSYCESESESESESDDEEIVWQTVAKISKSVTVDRRELKASRDRGKMKVSGKGGTLVFKGMKSQTDAINESYHDYVTDGSDGEKESAQNIVQPCEKDVDEATCNSPFFEVSKGPCKSSDVQHPDMAGHIDVQPDSRGYMEFCDVNMFDIDEYGKSIFGQNVHAETELHSNEGSDCYYAEVDLISIPGPPGCFLPSPSSNEFHGNSTPASSQDQSSENHHNFVDRDSSDSPSPTSTISNSDNAKYDPSINERLPFRHDTDKISLDPSSASAQGKGLDPVKPKIHLLHAEMPSPLGLKNEQPYCCSQKDGAIFNSQTTSLLNWPTMPSLPEIPFNTQVSCETRREKNFNLMLNVPSTGHMAGEMHNATGDPLGLTTKKACTNSGIASPSTPNSVFRLMGKDLMVVNKNETSYSHQTAKETNVTDSSFDRTPLVVSGISPRDFDFMHSYQPKTSHNVSLPPSWTASFQVPPTMGMNPSLRIKWNRVAQGSNSTPRGSFPGSPFAHHTKSTTYQSGDFS